jgi:hypothetical protein
MYILLLQSAFGQLILSLMTEEIIDDLKQFIVTTVSRIVSEEMSGLVTKKELDRAVSGLATKKEMNERFDSLDYKIDVVAEDLTREIRKVDRRLTRHIAASVH